MSEADRLNRVLASRTPALARALSPLGRAAAFPKGIPFQAAAARGTEINGTIGQVTDGAGGALPLDVLVEAAGALDPKLTFLYSPQPGHPEVRDLWKARQLGLAGLTSHPMTLPIATHGLTHGLGLVADLFVDADTTVLVPDPSWENYDLVFSMRTGATVAGWSFYDGDGLATETFADALAQIDGKAVVVLNFPSNPTGYAPTEAEADAIVAALAAHPGPLVVVVDDAYQGVVHESGRVVASLFWRVSQALDPERAVAIKVDGATKELMFFPSRIGFLSAGFDDAEAEAAWTSKINGILRGTVGSPPGPSQALMLAALRDPERTARETAARLQVLSTRYRTLRDALAGVDDPRIRPLPFNAAYFALIDLDPAIDADVVRQRLIDTYRVGTVHLPGTNALRVAYCSVAEADLPPLVERLAAAVADT